MIALLWCAVALFCGYAVVSWLPLSLYRVERVAWMLTLGILLTSWVSLILSLFLPYSLSIPLTFALLLLGSVGLLFYAAKPKKESASPEASLSWFLLTLFSTMLLGYLFHTHMLQVYPDGWHTVGGSWGDLALHSTLISYFAKQPHFTLSFPLYPDAPLTYPFVIDYFSGLLLRGGWSMQAALLVPGLGLALSIVQLIFFISYRLFARVWAGTLSVFLFLFNGSPAGVFYAYQEWQQSGLSLFNFLKNLPQDYSQHPVGWNLQFSNIPTSLLMPQRSILLGVAIFLVVTSIFITIFQHKTTSSWRLFLVMGLFLGLLPWSHPHTLIAALIILGLVLVLQGRKAWVQWPHWLLTILLMLILALPQLLWQKQGINSSNFSQWYLGGVRLPGENLLTFWTRNYGIEWLLLPLLPLTFKSLKLPVWSRQLYWGFFTLFVVANLYVFQPNSYDNIKLISYVHLGFSLYFAYVVVEYVRRFKWSSVLFAIAIVSLTITGGLAILQQLTESWPLLSNSDIAFAKAAEAIIPPEAIVLTSDQHNEPVTMLAGRHIVLGYRGWLASYGINYTAVQQDVSLMFIGAPQAPALLKKYDVSYVVIGPNEVQDWHADWSYYADHYPIVLEQSGWTVYKVD